MKLTEIIHEIAELLRAQAGISGGAAKVTEYTQAAETEEQMIDAYVAYKGTAQALLHGWVVTREEMEAPEGTARAPRKLHHIAIHGFLAVASSTDSEQLHQELTETVIDALNAAAHGALPNQAGYIKSFAQLPEADLRLFGGPKLKIAVWYSKITLTAT